MDETRSSSPWTWARTPFGPSSRMIFEIFLRVVLRDALLEAAASRYSLPDGFGLAGVEHLERDAAPDQLVLEHVEDGLGPLLAVGLDLDALSPDQAMEAPTPRKSNRVPISLAAWFSALSTS